MRLKILHSVMLFMMIPAIASDQGKPLQLVPVWERNVLSQTLRPPLLGAIAEDGTLCIAMMNGQEVVLLDSDGQPKHHLHRDSVELSKMVSISQVGYDALAKGFWIWSELLKQFTLWDTNGKKLSQVKIDSEIHQPHPFGDRTIYLRRPDQGSSFAFFSFEAAHDEELLIWQPKVQSEQTNRPFPVRAFSIGKSIMAVHEADALEVVYLEQYLDNDVLPLPKAWLKEVTSTNTPNVTIETLQHPSALTVKVDRSDRVWVFNQAMPLGVGYVCYAGENWDVIHFGILDALPLMVDPNYLFFVDVPTPNQLRLRKVELSTGLGG